LSIEHLTVAYKLGFSKKQPKKPSFDDVCEAVKALNQLSLKTSEKDRNMFIAIAALLWEHTSGEYHNLRDVLIHLLSRIGYAPSSVILDSEYSKDNKFDALHSFIAQIATEINQKIYEVSIGEHREILTAFQLSVSNSICQNRIVGISAPTSAGKSYVLLMEAVRSFINDKWDIIYIVPTISLINQVTLDFIKYFKKMGVTDVEIFNSYNPELIVTNNPHIFVLTQERAAAAFTMSEKPFNRQAMLIIDEIQNIERATSGDSEMRSKVLLDTIYEFRFSDNIAKIVVSGARISQIDNLSKDLLGDECVGNTTDISPVLNLTYSIKKVDNHYNFKQYCSLLDVPKSIVITDSSLIKGHGKKLYEDEYLSYLSSIVANLGHDSQNIIFTPNPRTARKTALALAVDEKTNKNLHSLSEYLKETVRNNYALADVIVKGVAYHHGKLPHHVRKVIEHAISEKFLSNVVCTTTLMQGVNMPAQNVIVRNPHLYVKESNEVSELSSYEMANLRGRAGRLLKDFIGRSFVLDENEFLKVSDEYKQESLFEDTYKELDSSYSSIFGRHRVEIASAMEEKIPSSQLPKGYAFIVTHIRQAILRHGDDAKLRLNKIGVTLSNTDFEDYKTALSRLKVPRDICLKNRYADPEMLDILYLDRELPNLPEHPTTRGAKTRLDTVLKYFRDNPNYSTLLSERVPKHYQNGQQRSSLCDMAIKWAGQKSLKEILESDYYNDADNVEDAIDLLQKTVSYNLPILLKPLYDIKGINANFVTFLEAGAYQPIARKLIEIGIPRETAIYLDNNYFAGLKFTGEDIYSAITMVIRSNSKKIPYWIRVQLSTILYGM
jgi:hypothetical protein